MNEINERHRHELWRLVKHLREMRLHLCSLAHGVATEAGVFHRAYVHQLCAEIDLYVFRYHRALQLPPPAIEPDPTYVSTLQACLVSSMMEQEGDVFCQMLAAIALMGNERRIHQPKKGSTASRIVTALVCEHLDDLLTYCDIGVLTKVRTTGKLQIRCAAVSDEGRLLQTRLPKDGNEGAITLWNKHAGNWRYTGISIGCLLIDIGQIPDNIMSLPHWSELRPHVPLELSAHTSFATGKEQDT